MAKMISKSTFTELSLEHGVGNYFLRPDRILGCFLVDPRNPPLIESIEIASELDVEKNREQQACEKLQAAENKLKGNVDRIDIALATMHRSLLK
jgi:hypothetical protein